MSNKKVIKLRDRKKKKKKGKEVTLEVQSGKLGGKPSLK